MSSGDSGDLAVVDTDVWSHLFGRRRRSAPGLTVWREALIGRRVVIATQTRAEVLVGLRSGGLGPARSDAIAAALARTPVVPVTPEVVESFVTLSVEAKAAGHAIAAKIHTADRWVAATAIAIGAPLLSADCIYRKAPRLRLLDVEEGDTRV